MKFQLRFTGTGSLGAIFFVGATLISGLAYTDMMRRALSPHASPSFSSHPLLYVALSTIGALGLAMMLSGRELVSGEIAEMEQNADREAREAAIRPKAKIKTIPVDPEKYRD